MGQNPKKIFLFQDVCNPESGTVGCEMNGGKFDPKKLENLSRWLNKMYIAKAEKNVQNAACILGSKLI